MPATLDQIYGELRKLKEEVVFIKKHMFDPDTIMTSEEGRRFEQSMDELREGTTMSLDKLKKQIGL